MRSNILSITKTAIYILITVAIGYYLVGVISYVTLNPLNFNMVYLITGKLVISTLIIICVILIVLELIEEFDSPLN